MKKVNVKELNNLKEGEFVYCGYFNFNGKEVKNNKRIQKLSGFAVENLNKDGLEFYKIDGGYATKFAINVLGLK